MYISVSSWQATKHVAPFVRIQNALDAGIPGGFGLFCVVPHRNRRSANHVVRRSAFIADSYWRAPSHSGGTASANRLDCAQHHRNAVRARAGGPRGRRHSLLPLSSRGATQAQNRRLHLAQSRSHRRAQARSGDHSNQSRASRRATLARCKLQVLEIDQENIAAIYKSIQEVGDATGVDHGEPRS